MDELKKRKGHKEMSEEELTKTILEMDGKLIYDSHDKVVHQT